MSSLEDLLREKLGKPIENGSKSMANSLDSLLGNDQGQAVATGNVALPPMPPTPTERLTPTTRNDEQAAMINQMLQERAVAQPQLTQQPNPAARFQKLQQSLAPQAPIELSEDPEEMQRQIAAARQGQ